MQQHLYQIGRTLFFLALVLISKNLLSDTQISQTNWGGGIGTNPATQFTSSNNINSSTTGQLQLSQSANWFDSDWTYRKEIEIDFTAGSENVSEYQVIVELDTDTLVTEAKLNSDCSDLRFTNETGTELPYFIFTESCNTTNTKVFVQVDELTAGTTQSIYAYYGNSSATDASDLDDVFTYSTLKTVGFHVDPILAATTVNVISLADDNTIEMGGIQKNLNAGGTDSFTGLSLGDEVKALGPFHADSGANGADMLMPVSFAGTDFVHYADRSDHQYTIFSPYGDATVTASMEGSSLFSGTVTEGSTQNVSPGTQSDKHVHITSDIPIYVHHYALSGGNPLDSQVLYPSTAQDLFGIPSQTLNVAASTEAASISIQKNNGTISITSQSLSSLGKYQQAMGGSQGTTGATKITSNAPIAAFQLADSDGSDTTTFFPESTLGTKFGSPQMAQYVSIAAPYQNTECTLYDNTGSTPSNPYGGYNNPHTAGTDSINWIYFGQNSGTGWQAGGWTVECNNPVYAIYESEDGSSAEPSDEHNLWTQAMLRQYTYPEPQTQSPEEEEALFETSGTLESVIYSLGSNGATLGNLSFTTSDSSLTNVKFRSGSNSDLSDATDFSSCSALTSGSSLLDSNCVSETDAYLQYQITLTSDGESTPTFSDITFSYESTNPDVDSIPGSDQFMTAGQTVELNGSSSTGSNLTYHWFSSSASVSFDDNTSPTPTVSISSDASSENIVIYLTVRDDADTYDTDSLQLILIPSFSSEQTSQVSMIRQSSGVGLFAGTPDQIVVSTNNSVFVDQSYSLDYNETTGYVFGFPQSFNSQGSSFLFLPSDLSSGFSFPEDLTNLDSTSYEFQFEQNTSSSGFGDYVLYADLNGDSTNEVLIASTGTEAGELYVFETDGTLTGVIRGTSTYPIGSIQSGLTLLDGSDAILVSSRNANQRKNFGFHNTISENDSNKAFLLQENLLLGFWNLTESDLETIFTFNSALVSSVVGDLNNDSENDVAFSTTDGRVLVYYGPFSTDKTEADADLVITSFGRNFGTALDISDVNQDSKNDLIVSEPEDDKIYIIFGRDSMGSVLDATTDSQTRSVTIDGAQSAGQDILAALANASDSFQTIYVVDSDSNTFAITEGTTTESNVQAPEEPSEASPASGSGGCSLNPHQTEHLQTGLYIFFFFCALAIVRLLFAWHDMDSSHQNKNSNNS